MDHPIAIKFGGSTCSVGLWLEDGVELIYNERGRGFTPSCVAYTDDAILVGDDALDQQCGNITNTIYDMKYFIGRKLQDPVVQNGIKAWPFKLCSSESDVLLVEVMRNGKMHRLLSEEVVGRLLCKMKELAEAYLGDKVSRVVLTAPANFNDPQRLAVTAAAELAGLKVMYLCSEPFVTVRGCEVPDAPNTDTEKRYVVCKWGGLSLDVALLHDEEGILEAIACESADIGGRHLTARLQAHVWEQLQKQAPYDVRVHASSRLKAFFFLSL